MLNIKGLHHISSMVKHPQENIDFYTNVLGLRLVKQTLNYDDKDGYHFYFADGDAKTALSTFFPMCNAQEGKSGDGQIAYYRYGIPTGTFEFWTKQLERFGIFYYTYERFDERIIAFTDTHGLELELVETQSGDLNNWEFNGITETQAIKGIESATFLSKNVDKTLLLLKDIFGYQIIAEDDEFYKLKLNDRLGSILYLNKKIKERGMPATGTVHHIAFEVADEDIADWRKYLVDLGYHVTLVKDRNYFKSIYFREPGGILIELATSGPRVTVDETMDELGTHFIVPKHYRDDTEIEKMIMPISVQELQKLRTYNYRDRYEYEVATKKEKILQQVNALSQEAKVRTLTAEEESKLAELRKEFVQIK